MVRRIVVLLAGAAVILAALLIAGGDARDVDAMRETLLVGAVYDGSGTVEITYRDTSGMTDHVVMEVLGMKESYQRTFNGSEFTDTVMFPGVPKYGWATNPVIMEVVHEEFGHVQIKTEIYSSGDPAPPIIYAPQ